MITGRASHVHAWLAACQRERGWLLLAAVSWIAAGLSLSARQSTPGPAYLLRSLDGRTPAIEQRRDLLETPMLSGSAMKIVALAAALEHGVIDTATRRICRRQVTVDGRQVPCAHPDLKRALTPAEALAHSCNDFFVALAPRLSRQAFNATRQALGLPPVPASVSLPSALLGLSGPPVTPRALLDALGRVVLGTRTGPAARLRPETRAVVREGLAGAATYGSAAALREDGVSALAKTGTAPMPGGGTHGLLVAWVPAEKPTRAMVVVAPGAAGRDAAAIAADLLGRPSANASSSVRGAGLAGAPGIAAAPERLHDPSTSAPQLDTIRVGLLQANGRTKVEQLPLDAYVARVLAGEGQPRAADAAQQALAIAARTFAVANRNRHRRDGYDLCDSTHCQVLRPATPATTRAAETTAGRVLLHDGAPAFVFYSAWCGGRPALASEVWPGARDYGEPAARDEACAGDEGWSTELRARDLERVLRGMGLRGDRLRDLRVTAHGPTARAARLAVEGFRPSEVSAQDLRMAVGRALGWQHLKSTAFHVERTGIGYRFSGRGYGHGVGLCVVGAGHRATAGESADDILRFYYPGLTVSAGKAGALTAPVPTPARTVERSTSSGFRLRLPAIEEGDRDLLVRLLQLTRSRLVERTGVAAPATIQVTVHPTVESFGRATGQPWWTAGSTLGHAIELLPVSMLRQQGQLERTLRHELAHVLVDPVLEGRPQWVREGAALYFAAVDAEPSSTTPSRAACPTDAELSRPVSVGAQRDAYARAEACFRRAVARVKDWRRVGAP